jgi:5-carboxymethyl-2-hydroxymuconate isomerase
MPHIITHYSVKLAEHYPLESMFKAMHQTIAEHPSVDPKRVRSYTIPCSYTLNGNDPQQNHVLAITLKVLPGRDESTLMTMATDLKKIALHHLDQTQEWVVTVDVVLIHPLTYTH